MKTNWKTIVNRADVTAKYVDVTAKKVDLFWPVFTSLKGFNRLICKNFYSTRERTRHGYMSHLKLEVMETIPEKDKDFLAFDRNVYELTVSRAAWINPRMDHGPLSLALPRHVHPVPAFT